MCNSYKVKISDGILKGEYVKNKFAKYYSFKGIPYAEPPIRDLRFKPPQPVIPWKGVRKAKEFGPIAYQADMSSSKIIGSEDCLYLNVYTPELKPKHPIPVMVWIHGGAFSSGSGNDDFYGPEFLVNQGVILVTFNYRLEVLGFLSLNTEDIPGNAGMKDQVAALQWVHKNIKNFGGDPANVTIFGESAGGASVSYHLVSPMSKGLFKRAITQSGTSTSTFSLMSEPREVALALARRLGCYSEDDKELYDFFRNQPAESLVKVREPVSIGTKYTTGVVFSIVSEKTFGNHDRFFYGDPYDVLRNGVHEGVEVMTGYTEDEGLLFLTLSGSIDTTIELINNFPEYLVPKTIYEHFPTKKAIEVGKKIKQYYFGNRPVTLSDLGQISKLTSMTMFVFDIVQWAKITADAKKNKVLLYKFTAKTERNLAAKLFGIQKLLGDKVVVAHADDLPYLFPFKIANITVDKKSETYKLIDRITKLWINFAKIGNPTPDNNLGVNWAPYDLENQHYLDIGNQFVMKTLPDAEEIQFWENIFKEYDPKHVF